MLIVTQLHINYRCVFLLTEPWVMTVNVLWIQCQCVLVALFCRWVYFVSFFKIYFILCALVFCLHVCLWKHARSPEPELQIAVRYLWVLGIEPGSFGRAAVLFIIELSLQTPGTVFLCFSSSSSANYTVFWVRI